MDIASYLNRSCTSIVHLQGKIHGLDIWVTAQPLQNRYQKGSRVKIATSLYHSVPSLVISGRLNPNPVQIPPAGSFGIRRRGA